MAKPVCIDQVSFEVKVWGLYTLNEASNSSHAWYERVQVALLHILYLDLITSVTHGILQPTISAGQPQQLTLRGNQKLRIIPFLDHYMCSEKPCIALQHSKPHTDATDLLWAASDGLIQRQCYTPHLLLCKLSLLTTTIASLKEEMNLKTSRQKDDIKSGTVSCFVKLNDFFLNLSKFLLDNSNGKRSN